MFAGGSATYSLSHQCLLVLTDGTLTYASRVTEIRRSVVQEKRVFPQGTCAVSASISLRAALQISCSCPTGQPENVRHLLVPRGPGQALAGWPSDGRDKWDSREKRDSWDRCASVNRLDGVVTKTKGSNPSSLGLGPLS